MIATPAEVVLDASVAVRGLLGQEPRATKIVDDVVAGTSRAHAPDLVVSEVANALRVRVDPARWPVEAACERLDTFLEWPLSMHPARALAGSAIELASARELSVYDALYAALAEALDVPLVTSDRRLAEAVPGSVLVS